MLKNIRVIGIIVTYNGSSFIENCLNSLKKDMDEKDIIVIDNGSKDATVAIIEEKYTGVRLIRQVRNSGFGKANNIGLQMAVLENADYVFLLNQDVYVEEHSVRRLVDISGLYPEYGILSPMHLNGNGTALDNHFAGYVAGALVSDLYLGRRARIYPCYFVNAAAWLISKRCLETVGGFDPLYFHYGEDDDYLNRVRYFKMKIGVCPGVRIYHDRGPVNALSTYPPVYKMHLEILKRLTNINSPFFRTVAELLLQLLCNMIVCLVLLQFKNIYRMQKVFFSMVFRLNRIRLARIESKTRFAFLKLEGPTPLPSQHNLHRSAPTPL